MQRVMTVESASIFLLKSNPPQAGIVAIGKVPTTGWSHPSLNPWFYLVPPADGIQDFDFVAEPPTGISADVVSPIVAFAIVTRNPYDYWGEGKPLKGVRIHARENSVEVKLDPKGRAEERHVFRGGEVPWPAAWLAPGAIVSGDGDPFPLAPALAGASSFPTSLSWFDLFFAGKILRVYHTGDAITRDHRPDRANIELNPTTERIVHVWFG